jgi:hypothetical protein
MQNLDSYNQISKQDWVLNEDPGPLGCGFGPGRCTG